MNALLCRMDNSLSMLLESNFIQFGVTADQMESMYNEVITVNPRGSDSINLFKQSFFGRSSGYICVNFTGIRCVLYVCDYVISKDMNSYQGCECVSKKMDISLFAAKITRLGVIRPLRVEILVLSSLRKLRNCDEMDI